MELRDQPLDAGELDPLGVPGGEHAQPGSVAAHFAEQKGTFVNPAEPADGEPIGLEVPHNFREAPPRIFQSRWRKLFGPRFAEGRFIGKADAAGEDSAHRAVMVQPLPNDLFHALRRLALATPAWLVR